MSDKEKQIEENLLETKAQGFKVENGKLVYFSNMLDGYKYEYKDLQDICAESNGLLEKFNSYEEQLAFWKAEAEYLRQSRNYYITELQEVHNENCKLRIELEDIRKEMPEKIAKSICEKFGYDKLTHEDDEDIDICLTASELFEIARESFGVEVER